MQVVKWLIGNRIIEKIKIQSLHPIHYVEIATHTKYSVQNIVTFAPGIMLAQINYIRCKENTKIGTL